MANIVNWLCYTVLIISIQEGIGSKRIPSGLSTYQFNTDQKIRNTNYNLNNNRNTNNLNANENQMWRPDGVIEQIILEEIRFFILELVNNNRLYYISPNILDIMIENPNLENYIKIVIQNKNISMSEINSNIILQLLHLMNIIQHNKPITEFPIWLLEIVLNLQESDKLVGRMLNWIKLNKTQQMLDIFVRIMNHQGGEVIPPPLQVWIESQPNGHEIIEYLLHPDHVECQMTLTGDVVCNQILIQEPGGVTQEDILKEIQKFILEIINNQRLYFIPLNILDIMIKDPNLEKYINLIFRDKHIKGCKINAKIIIPLLHVIERMLHNKPVGEFPMRLLDIVVNLQGSKDVVERMLNWIKLNKTQQMLDLFLRLKNNPKRKIPPPLKLWIESLPNGQEFLLHPEHCHVTRTGIACTTEENILNEIRNFILEIINNQRLYYIPPNILNIMIKDPNLKKYIKSIIRDEHIKSCNINSKIIIQLLYQIEKMQHNKPITEFPIWLLEIVLNLQGTEKLVGRMLNWIKLNKTQQMLDIFVKIMKHHGGKVIPPLLKSWIESLPTGQAIIEYLLHPNDIKCQMTPNGDAVCSKIKIINADQTNRNINYNMNINENKNKF